MGRLSDDELEQWASGGNPIIERMAREIQERRAQDLTSEDIDTLEHARDILADSDLWQWPDKLEQKERAIAIVERLLTRGNR